MVKDAKNKQQEKLTPTQSFFLILLFVIGGFSIIMISIITTNTAQEDTALNVENITTLENSEKNLLKECFAYKTNICVSIKEGDFL